MTEETLETLTRSTLAQETGIGIEAIRFYETKGLLVPDFRDGSNYRPYRPDAVKRARIIRSAKELGFTLDEISELLDVRALQENPCPDTRTKAQGKIAAIDRKIAELKQLKRSLNALIDACVAGEPRGRCAIIDKLEEGEGYGRSTHHKDKQ